MRRATLLLLGAAFALGVPACALAQDDPDPTIVVTGERLTHEQAADYVRQVGVALGRQPVARWIDPVCPRVLGIAEEHASVVEAKMREIAREAGVPLAREKCDANIFVSFVGDAKALLKEIDERAPRRLAEVPRDARDALLNGDAPVRWWYNTDERSRFGTRRTSQTIGMDGSGAPGQGNATPMQTDALSHYSSSIISTQVNRTITEANVVIDFAQAQGIPLDHVAAYAAFVAFAEARASGIPPPGSILGLFAPDAKSNGMTGRDMLFLRALYRLPLDRPANRQRAMLARSMTDGVPSR